MIDLGANAICYQCRILFTGWVVMMTRNMRGQVDGAQMIMLIDIQISIRVIHRTRRQKKQKGGRIA